MPPYSGYATADWLRALVQNRQSQQADASRDTAGVAVYLNRWWQPAQSWLAACFIGVATALVAFAVDVSVETVSDWKTGRCVSSFWLNKRACCALDGGDCMYWAPWASDFRLSYFVYVASAVAFGIFASWLSMSTKQDLLALSDDGADDLDHATDDQSRSTHKPVVVKTMYMETGSGIPEIKPVLSGFDIPHLLSFKVMVVKSVGAVFAVATAMCLGK